VDGLSASATTVLEMGGAGAAGDGMRQMMDAIGALLIECSGGSWLDPAQIDALAVAIQAAADAGSLIYSATAKDACLARIQSTTCVDLMQMESGAFLSCVKGTVSGTAANGAGCGDSAECAAGYCDFATATCPGTCNAFVAPDGVCSHGEVCAAGLACDGVHCVAPTTVAIGGACNGADLLCAAGSVCGFNPSTWKS